MAGKDIMTRVIIVALVTSVVANPICPYYIYRILRRMTKNVIGMTRKTNQMLSILVNEILILVSMIFGMLIQPYGVIGEAIIAVFYSFSIVWGVLPTYWFLCKPSW